MNSLETLCFEKVKKLFLSKRIKVEHFKILPENLLEKVCSFVPTPQQIRAFGMCVRWARDVIREKSFYVNGKLEGQFIKWDSQGRVLEQAEYKRGRRNGITVLYEPSKNAVFSVETYRHDMLHGEKRTFLDGCLRSTETYAQGELHGKKLVYFPKFGKDEEQSVQKEKKYYRGLKDGKFFLFDIDGSILEEKLWVRGILVNDAR